MMLHTYKFKLLSIEWCGSGSYSLLMKPMLCCPLLLFAGGGNHQSTRSFRSSWRPPTSPKWNQIYRINTSFLLGDNDYNKITKRTKQLKCVSVSRSGFSFPFHSILFYFYWRISSTLFIQSVIFGAELEWIRLLVKEKDRVVVERKHVKSDWEACGI